MRETFRIKEADLPDLAKGIIDIVYSFDKDSATVVLLEGDLGAGKTTFTKALASHLGVVDKVQSPTFILKKEYNSPHSKIKRIVHVDAYRFVNPKEAKVLRLHEDLADPDNLVMIEWPNKMNYVKGDITMSFDVIDDDTREVTISYEEQ